MTEITKTILALPDWKTDGNWEAKCRAICKLMVIFFERRAFSGQEKDKNISIKLF
jgi:hypothetical protein